MFAVKDHTRVGNLRVEADDKIGEVQRGHAQDGRRTKRGSKKKTKNVLTSRLKRVINKWNRYHTAHGSASFSKGKTATTKCQQLKKKVHASSQKMIIGAKEGHEFIIRHFPTDQ